MVISSVNGIFHFLMAYVTGWKMGEIVYMNDIQTMSKNYMALLKKELMSRGLNVEQVNRVIKKTRFEECLAKFPEESIHYPIEATADGVLKVAAIR